MKSLYFLILLILCNPISTFSQQEGPQYTRISKGLQGKVKELVSTTYTIRSEGNQQQALKLYSYRYIYYPDGFIDSSFSAHLYDSLKWQFNYHYYWNGDTLCSTIHPENVWSKALFNKSQLPVYHRFFSEKSYVQHIETYFEYDTMGRPVRISGKNDPPGKGVQYQYKKNPDGLFTQTRTDQPGPDYKVFNSKRQMIRQVYFNDAKTGKTERQFFYNEQGDLITEKEMMYKKEGEKWVPISKDGTTKTYLYIYDQQNKWISMETTYNRKAFELEKRIISYWD